MTKPKKRPTTSDFKIKTAIAKAAKVDAKMDAKTGELPANKVMTGGSIRPKARPAKKK